MVWLKKILTSIILFFSFSAFATPPTTYYTSVADDDWETAATWDQASAPSWNQTTGTDDITIASNVTLTDNLNVKAGTVITVNAGDTLVINGNATFNNGSTITVNGVLIITGDVTNNNNSDDVTINGVIIINGNYDGGNGSAVGGTGEMEIDGSVTTDGSGTVFGSDTDCTSDCDNSATSPLPIELLEFYGYQEKKNILLFWTTGSEINNEYFSVERMGDSARFESIGTIRGAGNSTVKVEYEFIDNDPVTVNYYRLKQVDYDGQSSTSDVIIIPFTIQDNKIEQRIVVYPNPAREDEEKNIELIGFKGKEVLVVVQDILGNQYYSKVVISIDSDDYVMVIDPHQRLISGTYLVIGSSDDRLYKKKLIVK